MIKRVAVCILTIGMLLSLITPASAHHMDDNHWLHYSAGQLDIWIEDHASPRWTEGLNHAARQWSRSPYIAMRIVAKCPANAEVCIPAYSYYKADHALGWANTWAWPNQHFVKAKVKFNNYYSMSRAKRRYVVIHEIGHAIGLRHSRYSRSVMYHGGTLQYPDAHDFSTLAYRYRHRH